MVLADLENMTHDSHIKYGPKPISVVKIINEFPNCQVFSCDELHKTHF